jgi:hypothetical protein
LETGEKGHGLIHGIVPYTDGIEETLEKLEWG